MASESYLHRLDWPKYPGAADDSGSARYINTGCLVIKDPIPPTRSSVEIDVAGCRRSIHPEYGSLDCVSSRDKNRILLFIVFAQVFFVFFNDCITLFDQSVCNRFNVMSVHNVFDYPMGFRR